jgi:UPF0716 protein FxsA
LDAAPRAVFDGSSRLRGVGPPRTGVVSIMLRLLVLFTIVPIVETILLLKLGELAGWKVGLAVILGTGIAGAVLARWQGLRALRQFRREVLAGRAPTGPLVDGLLILLAGALMIAPGILTDLAGITLLVPQIRRLFRDSILRRISGRVVTYESASVHRTREGFQTPHGDKIIDVEVLDGNAREPGQRRDPGT